MIAQKFEYTAPKSLDEALHLLSSGAKPLAGGMSLIPMMKLRLAVPEHLVDLRALKDLNYIREAGGQLHIGATASHYEIESSALLRQKCPLLTETAASIGDVQVRNMGTIGGSVAHADPAADYPAALDRKSTRLNSSHGYISYAVFCLKKKKEIYGPRRGCVGSRRSATGAGENVNVEHCCSTACGPHRHVVP